MNLKSKGFNPDRNIFERQKYEQIESGPTKQTDPNALADEELFSEEPKHLNI